MNKYLTEQDIQEIIAGNDSDFIESEDNFSSEESENDETVIFSNISNAVHEHIHHSFTWNADKNFKRFTWFWQ